MFDEAIIKAVKELVKTEFVLEVPPDASMGDYAFPCFTLAKEWKKSPPEIAKELAEKITKPAFVDRIEAKGAYVNFYLDKTKIGSVIIKKVFEENFGKSTSGKNELVAVEFSSPNIGKPFHFGHLRSTIIGESISRLLETQGFRVERLNYLGDWGTQFGGLIYAFKEWGDESHLEKEPVKYLLDLYVKFNGEAEKNPGLRVKAREWFAKLEQGDDEATSLWGLFKSHSLEEFNRLYAVLGIAFDSYNGESYYSRHAKEAIEIMRKKGIAEEDEGALIVRLEGHEMPMMLRKSDGATTYASRDVAALLDRIHTLKAEQVFYVVDHGQSLHFEQLFQVVDKLDHSKKNFHHVAFGLYLSPEGGKLSTRKGKVVLMEDVLNEAMDLAKKTIEEKNPDLKNKEEMARFVAIGAIVFGDLFNDRIKDVTFDLQKILSFEGDTGPYLMYTHARAASVLRKADSKPSAGAKCELLTDEAEQKVLKLLRLYPEKVASAAKEYKPHILAQYLIELGRAFNEFYHKCPVLQAEDDLKRARLALIEASRQILDTGLHLLGVTAPSEM